VVVISGPGGVGKGTLVERLLARDPRLWLSRSWTTRARRPGEPADAYRFATREEFERHAAAGGFLEWVEFLDYLQGSPFPDPPPGHDVVFEIDVEGAARVLEAYPHAVLVFVDAPDRAQQAERLRGRGDSEERIAQRLAKAREELARAAELPFIRIVNDDVDRAVDELERIVARAREAARSV
jgi:guanylate kinase